MNANQFRLMFIPLLATLILGGFVTTVGLLTEPASLKYGVELTDIASQFAWFTGGVFLGNVIAFFVFDYFSINPPTIEHRILRHHDHLSLFGDPLLSDYRDTTADYDGHQSTNSGEQKR